MSINSGKVRSSVKLNSIVTLRCQNTDTDSKETIYKTFKIVDDPSEGGVDNGVGINSSLGKALRGGIKNQKILIQDFGSATIVDIVNERSCRKVGKENIIEIKMYKDFDCTDLIGTQVLGCEDDIRDQFNNKEINSVVKLYNFKSSLRFAKITKIKGL